mmetsp:Transcript_1626/g.2350  ORF Transcript_1626/g.2350 Transcript_1626/m.2350 type:complete len:204 (+) Transcript_1626:2309-2920(+)
MSLLDACSLKIIAALISSLLLFLPHLKAFLPSFRPCPPLRFHRPCRFLFDPCCLYHHQLYHLFHPHPYLHTHPRLLFASLFPLLSPLLPPLHPLFHPLHQPRPQRLSLYLHHSALSNNADSSVVAVVLKEAHSVFPLLPPLRLRPPTFRVHPPTSISATQAMWTVRGVSLRSFRPKCLSYSVRQVFRSVCMTGRPSALHSPAS